MQSQQPNSERVELPQSTVGLRASTDPAAGPLAAMSGGAANLNTVSPDNANEQEGEGDDRAIKPDYPEGVHAIRKRLADGQTRWYVYAWRSGGPQIMTSLGTNPPELTPVAMAAFRKACRDRKLGFFEDQEQTLGMVLDTWRDSPEWARFASSTGRLWDYGIAAVRNRWGDVPLSAFEDTRILKQIIAWRNTMSATPCTADLRVQVLYMALRHARQEGLVQINLAKGIGKLYVKGRRSEIIWTDADIEAFRAAVVGTRSEHLIDAVELAAATGLRRADLVRLTWDDIDEISIRLKASKRSRGVRRAVVMPRLPDIEPLLARLKSRPRQPGVQTVLVSRGGEPWNPMTLSVRLHEVARRVRLVHVERGGSGEPDMVFRKHLHDLRGTFATKLMVKCGLSDADIADVMGWSPDNVRRIRKLYVDDTAWIVALSRRIAGRL